MLALGDSQRKYGGVADGNVAKRDLLDFEVDIRRRRADGAVLGHEVARNRLDHAAVRLAGECLDHFDGLVAVHSELALRRRAHRALDERVLLDVKSFPRR